MTRARTRRSWLIGLLVAGLVAALLSVAQPPAPAQALSGSDFDAGNIISDAKFFDGSAMSADAVQQFMNSQVPSCRSGYTCLKDYRESTWTRAADQMCGQYTGVGNESSAQIIAKVGQACGISQKVLLVLLQKEQSLVGDTFPDADQFDRATGFACPDTAPCDSQYYGFYNQVYKAAWQYKRYTNPPGTSQFFTWFPVGQVSNILYNPNSACGSSPVTIRNSATAALYYYTPYQPNAVALSNLYGSQTDGCSAYGNRNFWRLYWDWFGSPTDVDLSPVGKIENVTSAFTNTTITGWTLDPETTASLDVHVYIGGTYDVGAWGGAYAANLVRNDIGQQYPANGNKHGFQITLATPNTPTQVCLYAYNIGQGSNLLLGCNTIAKPTGPPHGNVESATISGLTATVSGWVIDPDIKTAVPIHVFVNGAWTAAFTANLQRPDIATIFPEYGGAHGFTFTVPVPVGTSSICVNGIDDRAVLNPQIGCKTVSTGSGPPHGNFEATTVSGFTAKVSGWALDLDTADSIDVHAYVNGAFAAVIHANGSRPDVGRVFPGYGDAHGFAGSVALHGGANEICLFAYNVGAGVNTVLGCTTVNAKTGSSFGHLEASVLSGGKVDLIGWALDPDTAASIPIHVYVNGVWGGVFTADAQRSDVGAAYPGYGNAHGFNITVPVGAGTNSVCVYAIDTGGGSPTTQLECVTLTVKTGSPIAHLEAATQKNGKVNLIGWALDPDTSASIPIHVYVNGVWGGAFTADASRGDVAAAYPGEGAAHGFNISLPVGKGPNTVCVFGFDIAGGNPNTSMACPVFP